MVQVAGRELGETVEKLTAAGRADDEPRWDHSIMLQLERQLDKLAAKLAEAGAAPSDERVHQEVVLYAARIDVDEELSRLTTHIAEFRRVLDRGGACGKRLDFLCQELNREANTLGSKSVANEMTRISVELKVLIEQMREQVQNIE